MHAQVSHIIPFRIRHSPLKNTPKQRVKQRISVSNLIMPYKYKKYSLFHEKCLVLTEKHVKRIFEKKKMSNIWDFRVFKKYNIFFPSYNCATRY